jgi:hypothetical protein
VSNFEEQIKQRLAEAQTVINNLRRKGEELIAARREPSRLEPLIALLIEKGIITEDELASAAKKRIDIAP